MAFIGLLAYFVALYIRPQDWVEAVLYMPIDYIIFVLVLFFGLITRSPKEIGLVLKMPQIKLMMLWVTAIFLSNLVHGELSLGLANFFSYLKFFIILFSFALFIDSFGKLKGLLIFMVFLTTLLAIQGIQQKATGIGWAGQSLGWLGRIRWVGLWDGMNVLCLLFVVSFPFLLQFFFGPWGVGYKLYVAVCAPLIVWAVYLTNSRGGFLSLMIVFFIHFRSRFKNVFGVVLGVVLVGGLCAFAPSRFGDFNDEDRSASHRIDMWIEGFEMLRYNPVLGIGKGNFLRYTHKLIAHNSFIENMGETGMVGLFFWVALLYVSVRSLMAARDKLEDPKWKSIINGLLICITGYIITSFFITAEFELLYVLLGLSVVVARLSGVEVQFFKRDFRNVVCLQLAGILFFWGITKAYYQIF